MNEAALLDELSNPSTSHQRRLEIGETLAINGDSRPGVGLQEDGLPDIEWCPVEAGTVTIVHETFQLSPFYIAQYPVTFIQYQSFVSAAGGYNNPEWWRDMPPEYHYQELATQQQSFANHPRDSLSWYQAVAFSRWVNAHCNPHDLGWIIRLPVEWEWLLAAQNGPFAFGEWQDGYANTAESELNQIIAVGMYPHAKASCGALDMVGNI